MCRPVAESARNRRVGKVAHPSGGPASTTPVCATPSHLGRCVIDSAPTVLYDRPHDPAIDGSRVRMELIIETLASGWPTILDACRSDGASRIATRHGISFDLAGLTIVVTNPYDRAPPLDYEYPELISDYADRLFGDQRDDSLIHQRMHKWQGVSNEIVDQIVKIEHLLSIDRNSRSAVFSLWDPLSDPGSDFPVSPVGGCFRVVANTLTLFVTVRSVDVVLGLVPEILAFSQLATTMALDMSAPHCRLSYHCWSAHMYEIDYLRFQS